MLRYCTLSHCEWIGPVPVLSGRSSQEAELDQRPDRQRKARQLEHKIQSGIRTDAAERARQHVEHQKPPAALVAVVQALDGDGDGRNDDGDAGDADDQEDAQYICGEGEGEAEKDKEDGHSDEIDDERKPVFRAIDAPAKAEQQLKQIPEQQLKQVHGHPRA